MGLLAPSSVSMNSIVILNENIDLIIIYGIIMDVWRWLVGYSGRKCHIFIKEKRTYFI